MATRIDILNAETITATSGSVSPEEIKNLIDNSATEKRAEAAKIQTQVNANTETRRELVAAGDLLAAESADVADAQKKAILAETAAENEKLTSILESQETYRTVLDNNRELLEGAQNRALAKQKEAEKYEKRSQGLKQNAEGDWVKMSPLERVGSMLLHNWEKYDSELAADASEESWEASQEAKAYAVNRAQILQNMINEASTDPDYLEKQRLANNAIAITEMEKVDVAQQQVVLQNLEKEYGFGQDHIEEMRLVVGTYDEAEQPRLYMQLLGLELQAKQLGLAFQNEQDQQLLKEAFKTTYTNYLTGVGEDPTTDQNKANTEIYSSFAAEGDLKGLAFLSQEDPTVVKEIANLYGKDTTIDVLSEMPASSLLALSQSEDPTIQTYAGAYKANYLPEAVRADKDFVEDTAKSLSEAGLLPDSEEYAEAMQNAIAQEADRRSKETIKQYQSNSIDIVRTQNKLEPAKSAVAAILSQSLRSPEGMVAPNVANRMQTFATYFDQEVEKLADNPSRFVENLLLEMQKGDIPNADLRKMNAKDLAEYAEAMAETFGAVQATTDVALRDQDKLYTPRDEWILDGRTLDSSLTKSLKGKDVTDASTWLFVLRSAKANLGGGGLRFLKED